MSQLIASAGPFKGVRSLTDAPYDAWQQYAINTQDGYFRDSDGESSWVQRPGFTNTNPSALINSASPSQGKVSFVDPATGAIYRYFAAGGNLYRDNSEGAYTAFVDVTPVGVAIDSAAVRVSFVGVGSSLVVTDGVNRPWVMSSFDTEPVVGTYIDLDGAGGAWSTWGKPTLYQDSVMFIVQTIPGDVNVEARIGIVWCEPNQPLVGYEQDGYENFWNIIENGSEPLYAILGTNNGLFYWREASIGLAAGTPSINFSTTATRDYKGEPVGSVSPWAIAIYNNTIFFLDPYGRPWMMALDGDPQPIWLQAYSGLASVSTPNTSTNATGPVGAIVPELDLYLVSIITGSDYGFSMLAFSASTGAFHGQWTIKAGANFRSIQTMDQMLDVNGLRVLCITTDDGLSTNGYVWLLNSILNRVWKDTGDDLWGPTFSSGYLSYSASRNLQPDMATVIVRSPDTMQRIAIGTGYNVGPAASIANVTPTSGASSTPPPGASGALATFRAEIGLDGTVTRWISFQLTGPVNPTMQWGVQRIEVFGSTSAVGAGDR